MSAKSVLIIGGGVAGLTDVATPLSYERYTGNWQGSSCGSLLTTRTMPLMIAGLPHRLPGLRNLLLAGQWVEPGEGCRCAPRAGRTPCG